jgi:hypothetical protein
MQGPSRRCSTRISSLPQRCSSPILLLDCRTVVNAEICGEAPCSLKPLTCSNTCSSYSGHLDDAVTIRLLQRVLTSRLCYRAGVFQMRSPCTPSSVHHVVKTTILIRPSTTTRREVVSNVGFALSLSETLIKTGCEISRKELRIPHTVCKNKHMFSEDHWREHACATV